MGMSNHLDINVNRWHTTPTSLSKHSAEKAEDSFERYMQKNSGDASPLPLEKLTPDAIRALAANLITMLDRASMSLMFSESDYRATPVPAAQLTTDLFMALREGSIRSAPAAETVAVQPPEEKVTQPIAEQVAQRDPVDHSASNFSAMISSAAKNHGLDAKLIEAVIQTESDFNPDAVSPVGAQGLMQLMPGTAADLGVKDPFDAQENIEAGSRYLKQLVDRYDGDIGLALAAYNWGMGNLERHPERMPQETINYVAKITGMLNPSA